MRTYFPQQFEKVSPKKVSDFIFDQLEESIILKELLPEEQLPNERDMAVMFNASRLAVREALSRLEEEGLIEKRVGAKGGTFVLPLTLNSHHRHREQIASNWESWSKVFEYRLIIEPEAAFLAAQHIQAEQLHQLQQYLEMSIEQDCSRELFRALDVKFHLMIAKASDNAYFEKAVREIRTKINPALDLMPYSQEVRVRNSDSHFELLDVLRAHDGERSRILMRQHIEQSASSIYHRVFDHDIRTQEKESESL
ncbi:HTH-type transcriptional regulator Mce2R [Paenibacillus nuruki]|uniref:HTH-type transcriptional regulator Mce2R n=1 Tax=Paenibacillus nuruki TaxID=1886670 RepID=A0A1E3L7K5_9BACL|nr:MULTISPECIES: FCD domain-containing protein [Paenibacillus]ODP29736.1 HTH-type transcriptional regulator Mce2R [Paenibacillus nuruki]TKJ91467.1 FadR family transcriptional regulator [Paenibacillus sp. CFBP13512]